MLKYNIYTTISALLFGFVGYLSMSIVKSTDMDAFSLMFWRFLLATLSYIVFLYFFTKQEITRNLFSKNTKYIFIITALFYVPSCILCFYASITIGVGLGIVSFFSFPIFVSLLTWYITKSPPHYTTITSIIFVLIGISLISPQIQANTSTIGILYGLSAAFIFACYIVSFKKIKTFGHEHYTSFVSCLTACIIYFIVVLFYKKLHIPSKAHDWFNIISLATIATAIPTYLLINSINKISTNKIAILSSLEPVFAILLGVTLLKEQISKMQYCGVLLVITGSIIIQFERHSQPREYENI